MAKITALRAVERTVAITAINSLYAKTSTYHRSETIYLAAWALRNFRIGPQATSAIRFLRPTLGLYRGACVRPIGDTEVPGK